MKKFPIFSNLKFQTLLKTLGLLAFVMTLASCASSSWVKQADSPLPIEVIHFGTGRIMSFRAHETSDRLYVSGLSKQRFAGSQTHIDIQLLDASGNVLSEKEDDVGSAHPAPGGGRRSQSTYVASFPLSLARQAASIRIVYHDSSHPTP